MAARSRIAARTVACFGVLALAAAAPLPLRAGGGEPTPGSLPDGFRYSYADAWRGWPVAPVHEQHPIRGGFLAPRLAGSPDVLRGGYHFGVDIAVDDAAPDPGAPPGRSHRVYAVEGGVVTQARDRDGSACITRRLAVRHFSYWHVDPTVALGSRVRAGDPIGWTCKGEWHVHLSEWARYRGERVWVNPLHGRGKLLPYVDTAPPEIRDLRFVSAAVKPVDPATLRGRVEILARIDDLQSFEGWLARDPRLVVPDPPYRVEVTIRDAADRVVLHRVAFRADRLPETPFGVHYAAGTSQDVSIPGCLRAGCEESGRPYVFRPLSRGARELWNTRETPPGRYLVTLNAWDERGNVAGETVAVEVGQAAR